MGGSDRPADKTEARQSKFGKDSLPCQHVLACACSRDATLVPWPRGSAGTLLSCKADPLPRTLLAFLRRRTLGSGCAPSGCTPLARTHSHDLVT